MLARLFERDDRQQVLWFSGPPLAPGAVKIPLQATHSLEYLAYLTKRKRNLPDDGRFGSKRGARYDIGLGKGTKQPLDTEGNQEVQDSWWTQGMSSDQLAAGLRAVIDSV